jgi:hypothetical protein
MNPNGRRVTVNSSFINLALSKKHTTSCHSIDQMQTFK